MCTHWTRNIDIPTRKILTNYNDDKSHVVFSVYSSSISEHDDTISRSEITCFRCGERGHKKQECRTWKTKMCRNESCSRSIHCPFAHTAVELRTPWIARCIRVVREAGVLKTIGCGEIGHTYRDCPHCK